MYNIFGYEECFENDKCSLLTKLKYTLNLNYKNKKMLINIMIKFCF